MGEHHKTPKPNATVRFNMWLLASRVSESLEASHINADAWATWVIEADTDGHKQARLSILERIVAAKQMNPGYSAEVLDMAQETEKWIGANVFEQLAASPSLYRQ